MVLPRIFSTRTVFSAHCAKQAIFCLNIFGWVEPSSHFWCFTASSFLCLLMSPHVLFISLFHCGSSAVTSLFLCCSGSISNKLSWHSSFTFITIHQRPQGWQLETSNGRHSDSRIRLTWGFQWHHEELLCLTVGCVGLFLMAMCCASFDGNVLGPFYGNVLGSLMEMSWNNLGWIEGDLLRLTAGHLDGSNIGLFWKRHTCALSGWCAGALAWQCICAASKQSAGPLCLMDCDVLIHSEGNITN